MALFGCTECGEKVSSEAATCPKCGAPVSAMIKKIDANRRKWKPTKPAVEPAEKALLKSFLTKPFEQHTLRFQVIAVAIAAVYVAFLIWPDDKKQTAPVVAPIPPPIQHRDPITSQFSGWDGSHIALTKLIKARLNDPGSYEHDKTVHVLKEGQIFIMARFRATNGFGALVLQNVTAQASAKGDGKDVTILSWE